MQLTKGEETITYPCMEWRDEEGTIWSWPTLDFLQGRGFGSPPPDESGPSIDDLKTGLIQAVQNHLDMTAQSRGYDGILSLCSYALSTDTKYQAEGLAGVAFRDACWIKCRQIERLVDLGEIAIPTSEELIALMPSIGW